MLESEGRVRHDASSVAISSGSSLPLPLARWVLGQAHSGSDDLRRKPEREESDIQFRGGEGAWDVDKKYQPGTVRGKDNARTTKLNNRKLWR